MVDVVMNRSPGECESSWDLGLSRTGTFYFCVGVDGACAKVKKNFVRSSKCRKSPMRHLLGAVQNFALARMLTRSVNI